MNQHVAIRRSLSEIVEEYDAKNAAIAAELAATEERIRALNTAVSIEGNYNELSLPRLPGQRDLSRALLTSAWRCARTGLNVDRVAGSIDRKRIDMKLKEMPAFTLANIRDILGDFIAAPRYHVLKGLAEVFCNLDPAFKSHDKMKVGVKGLPKRVILSGFGEWDGYGREKVQDILRAMSALEGNPEPSFEDLRALSKGKHPTAEDAIHGVWCKKYQNGNAHLYFAPETLLTVNRALAEFYGEVLPDSPEAAAEKAKATGTAVSKDLQFYPTPQRVVDTLMREYGDMTGYRVLEPSCGTGNIMDALRAKGAKVLGIEVHAGRAAKARAKGHGVHIANFLQVPVPDRDSDLYDAVVMNPPFAGKHYAKHVLHAIRFLKPGGVLRAILPVTAREHDLLPAPKSNRWGWNDAWKDLPIGSFREAGTNVNTVIYTYTAPKS
ncbi:class I SAM-dependent methyltransferase [Poseidonocella sp. HB161398]|uniref:class I SAM-dependent methyltransferase n=1 Tax=Poseidonocella sp. HB161398 TaxID=2320855 RepID=UPI001109F122|nr:class I SAM-dependent methyltransferase [Poseidonocella sp. HB161398]